MKHNKTDLTVVLLCYNEASFLREAVAILKDSGFHNILVVDDGSMDNTCDVARSIGVKVINNNKGSGYDLAALKGLYCVETPFAFILSPGVIFESKNFKEYVCDFINFALIGNYAFLISQTTSIEMVSSNAHSRFFKSLTPLFLKITSRDLSKILRKKFGIFLKDPGFDAVFLKKEMIELVKNKMSGAGFYVYLKEAIVNNLKIGTYPLGLTLSLRHWRYPHTYRSKPISDFEDAFPDISKQEIKRGVMIGVGVLLAQMVLNYIF